MKNLNEEYKKSQQEETPDLWDRIERNLPEKKQGRIFAINRYLAVAAAALFLCTIIPGVWYLAGGVLSDSNRKSDSAAPMQMADCAQPEDSIQAEDSVQAEDSIQAEDNIQAEDSAPSEDALLTEESAHLGNSAQMDSAYEAEGSPVEDCRDTASQSSSPQDSVTESFKVTESLKVTDSVQAEGKTVYTLCGQDGNALRAILTDSDKQELQIGETYLCSLRKVAGEDWEYEILEIE